MRSTSWTLLVTFCFAYITLLFFSGAPTADGKEVPLNELTLERLEYPEVVNFAPLIPADPTGIEPGLIRLLTKSEISEWGYSYSCQNDTPPHLCVLSVNDG